MKHDRLRRLQSLADLQLQHELQGLARLAEAIRRNEALAKDHLTTLNRPRGSQGEMPEGAIAQLGVDELWRKWVQLKRVEAMREAARFAADREELLPRARQYLGRSQALAKLVEREKKNRT